MKIGIICYPSVGGSGIVATNLGKALAALGHEVHFISYDRPFGLDVKKPNLFFHQVSINEYPLFKYPDYTLPLTETILMVHQRYTLDVVHVHYAVPHATAALFAKRILATGGAVPPKIVTTLHGTDITLLAQDPNLFTVIKYSIERSDGVTAVSHSLKSDTISTLQTDKPIEVIHNFYTPEKITQSPSAIRKKLKISDDDFLAIHLSNLRPVKRIPDLLQIAKLMKGRKNFKLLILAGGDFAQFRPLVKKYGIAKSLAVLENIADIGSYINASDIGLYTSETESFGMGILETMAYGKPVLATRAGGIPEVLRDGADGYLFPVGSTTGFAKKLAELMANPDLTAALGRSAASHAREKFSSGAIVRQYLEFYCHSCDKRTN